MNKLHINILIISLLFVSIVFAQQDSIPQRQYNAAELTSGYESPIIDGRLNDDAWALASNGSEFTQIEPIEKEQPSENTIFKVLYDKRNIYVAIYAYDSSPKLISKRLSRRDHVGDSDLLLVGFDSYFDRRTSFVFGLNASGVKNDFIISEDGNSEDESWDPIWDGKVTITDSGWIAEMRIPFSQLRFSEVQEQVWGFQVYRKIHRKQEEITWQYIPKDAAGLVSYFGLLIGIHNIKVPSRIEFLPYAVTSLNTFEPESGNPYRTGKDYNFNIGLDGKIGVTSNLNLDYTVNPDFGQVEADPSDVNLSAFETFFQEKRPFFIEGKNIFSFPIFPGNPDGAESVFYSRRIGRNPRYNPEDEEDFNYDYVNMPDQSRILGAAKLSGKTSTGWSIGVLDAVTNKEYAQIHYDNQESDVAVEPFTNFLVGRLQKDFAAGNTSFGGIVTATNRKISEKHLDFISESAYTGGLDYRHQWNNKSYFIEAKVFSSHISGSPAAIKDLQESSARYFQRPDNNYVNYDTARTSLSGHGGTFDIGKTGNGNWEYGFGGSWRSPGLELNDIGFQQMADFMISYLWAGYFMRNPVGIFRRYQFNLSEYQGWNLGGDRTAFGLNFNAETQFLNYWELDISVNGEQPGLSANLLWGGPLARSEGGWSQRISIETDSRKNIEFDLGISGHRSDDDISYSNRFRIKINYRMNPRISFMLRPSMVYRLENLQYIDTIERTDDKRYVFGKINQKTYAFVFRLNYSPTPDISLQYYGQPFFSSGDYSEFKHVNNPRGVKSDRYYVYTDNEISYDREDDVYRIDEGSTGQITYSFEKPDYNIMEFLSNLVFRWEYRPGSTLYLVWSQFRDEEDMFDSSKLSNSFQNLFRTHPENVFLIKMNYWFSL